MERQLNDTVSLSLRFLWAALIRLLWRRIQFPLPRAHQVMACLSVLGLTALSFMLGAAVMFFRLPSSSFFDKAFTGAKAWHERGRSPVPSFPYADGQAQAGVTVDEPGRACDGFTLYTTDKGSWARLIDMRGQVVHQWGLPFHEAFPRPPHIRHPLREEKVHWFRCYLYPNGDLLAVYHAYGDTPYGYGLVKLDKDSRLVWAYAARAHHDLDVGEDGAIYTLTQTLVSAPPHGLEFLPSPLIADSLAVLSPDGRELETLPLLEAIRDSPHFLLAFDPTLRVGPGSPLDETGDVVHANSVRVLSRALAPRFPLFRPGQVLVSLRSTNTLAVLDTHARSLVWAARGNWQAQHDAEFLENGHLLLYDNCGSNTGTRIAEYDPLTQAVPWAYAHENSEPFRALSRGVAQRLPNGNTLFTDPDQGLLLEVTPGKEVVWGYRCGAIVTGARRYRAHELTFLEGGAQARP